MNLQLIVIYTSILFVQDDKARITNTAFTVVALKEYKKAYESSSTDTSVSQSLNKCNSCISALQWSQSPYLLNMITNICSILQLITKLDTSITKAESFIFKRFTSVSETFCTYGLSLSVYALHKSPVSSDRLKGLMKKNLQERIQPSKECMLN